MRRNVRAVLCVLAVFTLMLASATTVFAAGNVTYKNHADKFLFTPGSEYSPTDLFTDFKGVMPGDSLSQQVTVKNEAAQNVDVEIFMRALGATDLENPELSQADSADFLKEMHLTVVQDGTSTLFEASADQTAQLTDWVSLGKFKSGAEVDLTVTLQVPITMGNDYQQRIGALDWQFKVVEYPVAAEEVTTPGSSQTEQTPSKTQTGDNFNLYLYAALAVAAIAVIGLIRKRKPNE